ncbi:MAG: DMT family transporter [Candidatus Promineifilaceae bacterium]|jgi:DME family drug/metabolite transporter
MRPSTETDVANILQETEQHRARRGMWFVLLASVLWGTTGTAQALAPAGASPLTIGYVRLTLGTVVLFLIAAQQGHLKSLKHWQSWPLRTTILAGAAVAAYQVFFFAGVARTGVAVGTIVGIGSTPIAAGILTFLVFKTFPGRKWAVSTFLALIGCALLILSGGDLSVNGAGILLAMAAGTSYALYTLLTKQLLENKPRGAVLSITFLIGSLLLLPILFIGDFSWLAEPRGILVALHLGVITVGAAYTLYAMGLSIISVAATATLTLAEPLTAGLLGIFLLGEQLSTMAVIGILLLLSGLMILVLNPRASLRRPTRNKSSIQAIDIGKPTNNGDM